MPKKGLHRSRLALWSKTWGGRGSTGHWALTCLFLHQPDVHWLWALQVVYRTLDLENKHGTPECTFLSIQHCTVFKLKLRIKTQYIVEQSN